MIQRLRAAAEGWLGTPFCVRGAVRGGGVSCHRLCVEIYRELGWWPSDVQAPHGRADWARWRKSSQMEAWLDESRLFQRLTLQFPPSPGDLLGLRGPADGCVNHVGIALDAGEMVHCLWPAGVQIVPLADPTFGQAVAAMWRPMMIGGAA